MYGTLALNLQLCKDQTRVNSRSNSCCLLAVYNLVSDALPRRGVAAV